MRTEHVALLPRSPQAEAPKPFTVSPVPAIGFGAAVTCAVGLGFYATNPVALVGGVRTAVVVAEAAGSIAAGFLSWHLAHTRRVRQAFDAEVSQSAAAIRQQLPTMPMDVLRAHLQDLLELTMQTPIQVAPGTQDELHNIVSDVRNAMLVRTLGGRGTHRSGDLS